MLKARLVELVAKIASIESPKSKVQGLKVGSLVPRMIVFDRARNADGEFAPQAGEGPDPATMRAAYGPVNANPSRLRSTLGIVADTAGAAGGAVTVGSMVAKKLRAAAR